MSRLFLLLFNFRNPAVQEAVRRNLRMRFHRYTVIDFLLNLITPLKLYAPPHTIEGISRVKLRFSYRGVIRVSPGNVMRFSPPSVRDRRILASDIMKANVNIGGVGNVFHVRGEMHSLPARLKMRGANNVVEIGANFRCTEPNLEWLIVGENNRVTYGDNVQIYHDDKFGTGEFIRMTGKRCSIEVGDNSRVRLLVESEVGASRDFHMRIGPRAGIASLYVDMASSTRVRIGEGFFCSWDSYLWCGAHALLDAEGDVLNECKKIEIGKNVWFGHGVEVPGEIKVADGCIIGSGVTLVSNVIKPGSIVAVAPAKIYPANVRWVRESPAQYKSGLKWEM